MAIVNIIWKKAVSRATETVIIIIVTTTRIVGASLKAPEFAIKQNRNRTIF